MKNTLLFIVLILLSACCTEFLSEKEIDKGFFIKIDKIIADRNDTLIYNRPVINSETVELSNSESEKHLYNYRKMFMCIFKKNKEKWCSEDERNLSKLYYHRIDINRIKKISSIVGLDYKKIFEKEEYLKSDEIGKRKLLSNIILSDIIIKGQVINLEKIATISNIHDFYWEYTILIEEVLYTSDYKEIPNHKTIRMLVAPLGFDKYYNDTGLFNEFYKNHNSGIFTFSKLSHYRFLESKYSNNLSAKGVELYENNKVFPVGNVLNFYKHSEKEIIHMIDDFKKTNNVIDFFKRNYE